MKKAEYTRLSAHYKLAKQLRDEIENIEKFIAGLTFRLKENREIRLSAYIQGVNSHPKHADPGCYATFSPDVAHRAFVAPLKVVLESVRFAYRKLPPLPSSEVKSSKEKCK